MRRRFTIWRVAVPNLTAGWILLMLYSLSAGIGMERWLSSMIHDDDKSTLQQLLQVDTTLSSFRSKMTVQDSTPIIIQGRETTTTDSVKKKKNITILHEPTADDDELQFQGSLSILIPHVLEQVSTKRQQPNSTELETICSTWGWNISSDNKRNRIFAGSLLADDSWHVLATHGLEAHGLYHTIVFVESDRTQSLELRTLRFGPNSTNLKLLQNVFGTDTKVVVTNYILSPAELKRKKGKRMLVEAQQRHMILQEWKRQGMTEDDIGLIVDADEIVSSSLLQAVQYCDIPPPSEYDCQGPLVQARMFFFEGGPTCVQASNPQIDSNLNMVGDPSDDFRQWRKVHFVSGSCIELIGDPSNRPKPSRRKPVGPRKPGYGPLGNYSLFEPNTTRYPLFNAEDFRSIYAPSNMLWPAGFHLHNFFQNTTDIRHKHNTYGHVHRGAMKDPLTAINGDLNVLVKCAMGRDGKGNRRYRVPMGLEKVLEYEGWAPEAFQLRSYVQSRQKELTAMIQADEELYGRADSFDAWSLYDPEKHLSHVGSLQGSS